VRGTGYEPHHPHTNAPKVWNYILTKQEEEMNSVVPKP
jgi:hypothetical protein